jgi:hypothetical protein
MRSVSLLLGDAGLTLHASIAEVASAIAYASLIRSFAETYTPKVKTSGL